jgi:hypothetical protein
MSPPMSAIGVLSGLLVLTLSFVSRDPSLPRAALKFLQCTLVVDPHFAGRNFLF